MPQRLRPPQRPRPRTPLVRSSPIVEGWSFSTVGNGEVQPAPFHTGPWYKRLVFRDQVGILLSALCLLHCLAPVIWPLALIIFQVSGMDSTLATAAHLESPWLHLFFLILVPAVGWFAFWPGWKRHRNPRIWYWAIAGLCALVIGVSLEFGFSSEKHSLLDPTAHAGQEHGSADLSETSSEEKHGAHFWLSLPTLLGGLMLIRAHRLNMKLQHEQNGCCEFDSQAAKG